ncbi:hypothetical protein NEUTE2DRAFT_161414 [Neurospora tetrasperma FGSC 2509]|nr:hypothetical protein NEUTE2DRAFT_161414 [Neurospora tetrasperma FGSC 2509]
MNKRRRQQQQQQQRYDRDNGHLHMSTSPRYCIKTFDLMIVSGAQNADFVQPQSVETCGPSFGDQFAREQFPAASD